MQLNRIQLIKLKLWDFSHPKPPSITLGNHQHQALEGTPASVRTWTRFWLSCMFKSASLSIPWSSWEACSSCSFAYGRVHGFFRSPKLEEKSLSSMGHCSRSTSTRFDNCAKLLDSSLKFKHFCNLKTMHQIVGFARNFWRLSKGVANLGAKAPRGGAGLQNHQAVIQLGGCTVYYVWEPRAFMTPPKNPIVYERLYV